MRAGVVLFFLPIIALAQPGPGAIQPEILGYADRFCQTDGSLAPAPFEKLTTLITRLEDKRGSFKNDVDFLNYLFVKTHQRLLRNFTDYVSFRQTLTDGTYNCLNGTTLYALLLDHFGFEYNIIETNYHIFLIAYTPTGRVLFEATDPLNGFVTEESEINARVSTYRQNALNKTNSRGKTYYQFNFELYNDVSLLQMSGLLHYNLAIVAYNQHQLATAIDHLDKAIELYQSPRTEEFTRVVLLSVVESRLDTAIKENYVRQLQSLRKRKLAVVTASSQSF
jgi:hypothetical protein